MQHETLAREQAEIVDDLLVLGGAERRDGQRLGLAAREERRTVGARQQADLAGDRADLVELAAVDATALLGDHPAGFALLEIAEDRADLLLAVGSGAGELGKLRERQSAHRLDRVLLLELAGHQHRLAQLLHVLGLEHALELGVGSRGLKGHFLGVGAGGVAQLELQLDELLDLLLAEQQGLDDDFLADLEAAGFDHQDRIRSACDHHVQGAGGDLFAGRVDDVLPVHLTDAHGADRAFERHARDCQRGGGAVERHDVGLVDLVGGVDVADDLHIVAEALREQRAQRPVDEAAAEDLALAGTALTAEEAARDLPGGELLLLVVDGQRKEVDALAGRVGGNRCREHRAAFVGHEDGAIGLLGHSAGLEGQGAPPEVHRYTCDAHSLDYPFLVG